MARELTAYGFAVTLLTVPAGYSLALLVSPIAGEVSSTLKWFSGGSLEILQAGFTQVSAQTQAVFPVQTAVDQGYLLSVAEVVNTDGAARYYLAATGTTTQAYLLRGLSQGF